MADFELEVLPPLADCFLHCEVNCVRECCGIDAISTDAKLIVEWSRNAGPEVAGQALDQLKWIITAVEDRSNSLSSTFLNHNTRDENARQRLLDFLQALLAGLQSEA